MENKGKKVHYTCSENLKIFYSRLFLKNEKWLSLNALLEGQKLPCGTKFKGQTEPTVCRPSIRIDSKTPKPLANKLTNEQIKKAIKIKQKGQRINWMDL